MNINWTQPITVYELIAIALSTIALIIPLIKYIYNHFIKTIHSKGTFDKKYVFSLSDAESFRLRNNIDSVLISHVANHFGIPVQVNTVTKDFKEKN